MVHNQWEFHGLRGLGTKIINQLGGPLFENLSFTETGPNSISSYFFLELRINEFQFHS